MPRLLTLVDCNNFYASCERVFDPTLHGKPLVVLSNNDGCVVARSNEAKAVGIGMGVPIFQVQDIVRRHNVRVLSSNYALYADMSQRVMRTLEDLSPEVEIYSIDEAWLGSSPAQEHDPYLFGERVRRTVQRWTGIPTSVGIAGTKTLTKIANYIAKRSPKAAGILSLAGAPPYLDRALECVPVGEVWGVGFRTVKLLISNGITTALHLKNADEKWIRRQLGINGLRMVYELRGIPCLPVETMPQPRKGLTCSRSFGQALTSDAELCQAVAAFATRAAEKLRRERRCARSLTVFIRTNRFTPEAPQYGNAATIELPVPSSATNELLGYAIRALERIWRGGYAYKKAGVMMNDLVPEDQVQTELFDIEDRERAAAVMGLLDGVNAKHGSGTLFFAATGTARRWATRCERRSPRYTTRWGDLVRVAG